MSVVIINGNECMERQHYFRDILKEHIANVRTIID